jgi:hypothetical protein
VARYSIRLAAAAAILVAMTVPAWAHSWYPLECCSGNDCEPIPPESFSESPEGWTFHFCSRTRPGLCIHGFMKRGREKISQDGQYHLCFSATTIYCFFVPVNT